MLFVVWYCENEMNFKMYLLSKCLRKIRVFSSIYYRTANILGKQERHRINVPRYTDHAFPPLLDLLINLDQP